MTWTVWWLFVVTSNVLVLMPGPAVLFVLSSALRAGSKKSVASALAIRSANVVYSALSATGIAALLISSYRLFFAIKWIGAGYLVFLGVRALMGNRAASALARQPGYALWTNRISGGLLIGAGAGLAALRRD